MTYSVTPTVSGFAVAVGSQTADFAFGSTNVADERLGDAVDFDVVRNSRGEFSFLPRGLVKLRMLGLYSGFKPDGSAVQPPDAIPFLIAAGIVQAPPAARSEEKPASLELIMTLPGAAEFPEVAKNLASIGMTIKAAREFLEVTGCTTSLRASPDRACNAPIGLVVNPAAEKERTGC